MQKIFNKIIITIVFFLITACAATWSDVKEGLGGQKRKSTDEFLVKKKDPLAMPPKWRDLPVPGQSIKSDEDIEEMTDIEQLIQLGKNQKNSENLEEGSGNLENSILKKIRK